MKSVWSLAGITHRSVNSVFFFPETFLVLFRLSVRIAQKLLVDCEETLWEELSLSVFLFLHYFAIQAIQHIERAQERRASAEEEQRRAVIVSPAHIAMDTACSDTDTDTEGEDCSMN